MYRMGCQYDMAKAGRRKRRREGVVFCSGGYWVGDGLGGSGAFCPVCLSLCLSLCPFLPRREEMSDVFPLSGTAGL